MALGTALMAQGVPYLFRPGAGLLHQAEQRFGPAAPGRLRDFSRALAAGAGEGSIGPLLMRVNRLANRIPYRDDAEHWQRQEYWATPLEFVASDGGDCDDYAIAKYYALREAGVAARSLRLVYARALYDGAVRNHMVLAWYAEPGGEPLVLDNLADAPLPASQRPDLVPVYSFNDELAWKEGPGGARAVGAARTMVRRWDDLQQRIAAELAL